MAKPSTGVKSGNTRATSTTRSSTVARQNLGAASAQPKVYKPSNFHMPLDLIERAKSWGYKTYGGLRRRLNKELAKHPAFLSSPLGTKKNVAEMKLGRNPYAPKGQTQGKSVKMQYDHHNEQRQIKAAYKNAPKKRAEALTNVPNLTMRSPTSHTKKLSYRFHKPAGTPVAGHSRMSAPSPVTAPKVPSLPKPVTAATKVQKSPMSHFKKR